MSTPLPFSAHTSSVHHRGKGRTSWEKHHGQDPFPCLFLSRAIRIPYNLGHVLERWKSSSFEVNLNLPFLQAVVPKLILATESCL